MKSFRVLATRYDVATDRIEVVKEITNDDDTTELNLHTFSPDTLEWKAAEYGIDDVDELVEIVLYEPFIEVGEPSKVSVEEARDAIRSKTSEAKVRLGDNRPRVASTIRVRLSQAGVDQVYIDSVDVDPLAAIKQHSKFDSEVIAVKREYVNNRKSVDLNRIKAVVGADRAAELRQRLLTTPGATSNKRNKQASVKSTRELPTVVLNGKRVKDI